MTLGQNRTFYAKPIEFERFAASGQHADVILVTKENLHISAHKVVLSQHDFWLTLFRSMECCSGNCSPGPTMVLLPDYDYRSIKLLLEGYYSERVYLQSENEVEFFTSLIKSFSGDFGAVPVKCRICEDGVMERDLVDHVLGHIKQSSSADIISFKRNTDIVRCSFTHPKICRIEKDRKTMTNGIFNNINIDNDEGMVEQIKEHYRRHLRDEIAYIRRRSAPGMRIPSEETLYMLAEVQGTSVKSSGFHVDKEKTSTLKNKPESQKVSRLEADLQTTKRSELDSDSSGSESNYSGGMSSPEEDGIEIAPGSVEKRKPVSRAGSSKSRSRISSGASDMEQKGSDRKLQCRECRKEFQSKWFKGHVITHLYNAWKVPEMGPYFCDMDKCKMAKLCDKKRYIHHLGTVHKELELKLRERGETLSDWDLEDKNKKNEINLGQHSISSEQKKPSKRSIEDVTPMKIYNRRSSSTSTDQDQPTKKRALSGSSKSELDNPSRKAKKPITDLVPKIRKHLPSSSSDSSEDSVSSGAKQMANRVSGPRLSVENPDPADIEDLIGLNPPKPGSGSVINSNVAPEAESSGDDFAPTKSRTAVSKKKEDFDDSENDLLQSSSDENEKAEKEKRGEDKKINEDGKEDGDDNDEDDSDSNDSDETVMNEDLFEAHDNVVLDFE